MKSKRLLITLLLAFIVPWAAMAQNPKINEGFEDTSFPPDDWTSIHVSGANSWARNTSYHHASSTACAWVSYATYGHENYLVTPKLVPATGEEFTFYAASQSWGGTTLTIEVSTTTATAAGFTTTLATYTTGSSGTLGSTSTSTWVEKTISLADYVGQQIYIAFHVVDGNGSGIGIDDVTGVTKFVPACPKPTNLAANATSELATLSWTSDADSWNLKYKAADAADYTEVTGLSTTSYEISVTPNTTYEWMVQTVCDGTPGDYTNAPSFTTPCVETSTFPWAEDFTGLTSGIPDCWDNSEGSTTTESYKWNYYDDGHDAAPCLRFNSFSNSSGRTNFLKTPVLNFPADKEMQLVFWWKNPTGGDFSVFISTDGGSTYTTSLATGLTSQSDWAKKEIDLTDYVGSQNVVIVFKGTSNWGSGDAYIYLDEVTVRVKSNCVAPTGLAAVATTTTSAELSWTPTSSETNWKLQYKKIGTTDYTTVDVAESNLVSGVYTLNGLDGSSIYNVRVAAWCGYPGTNPEDMSEYCDPISVVTSCEAISTFPWTEDFEGYPANTSNGYSETYKFNDPCWVNEHLLDGTGSSGGTYLFQVSSYTQSGDNNSTHKLQLPDMKSGTQTGLRLPEMTLASGTEYQFVIDVFRNTSGTSYTSEGVRVFASANGEIAGATELGFLYRNCEQTDGGIVTPETTQGWYTYEFPIPTTMTTCYIILRGESQYGSATYMDNFAVEQIPTCKRPSALMLETPSSRTAHSATLKWTNGSDDQTAWQIAYSTASNFNPDTVTTIVNVNTNPDTLTGLDQNTTYYAYVRANCGGGDNSSWSTAKATFKTLEGNKKPTNLAYDPATLTSSSVRVNWKGVATNELHMYYELYYDTLSTRPNPLVAENLKIVQGEIDTTYLLEGLQAEKKYYVWVRDTCGTDGYSAWTSSINFTTASACQTPDGLKANDVTINSASITWNTYGLSEFNLRYNNDRGDTITLTNVNSPCPLEDLTSNTPYQVQVQAACNPEAWSPVLNFSTDCDAISVASEAYFYDFETTQKWNCWTNIQGASISNYNSGDSGPYKGSCYLRFSGTYKNIAALPAFVEATNTLQIKFWTRPESNTSSSCGTFDVGYLTDLNDTSTFVKIERYNYNDWNVKEYRQKTVFFDGVPSDAVIAFRHNANSTAWYWFVDDVEVSVAPLCKPIKDFTISNVKAHSVDLAWTVYDETQTSFDVQYSVSQNFTEGDSTFINNGVSLIEGKYVLSGLTHDTTYYVRVRANCGGGEVSLWSDSKRVVTPAGNQAPSSFAVVYGSEGPHYVSLVWNQGGELATSWDLYYVKSETAPEEAPNDDTPATVTVNTLPTAEAPYLLEGLDAESRYYIWVRANCGIDGLSAWKALSGACFTTLEACPAPVNGEVTNLTPVSAQLNWTGYAENYNVRYRTAAYSYPTEGSFFEGFESGTLNGWTAIRGNEGVSQTDWHVINSETLFDDPIPAHSGTNVAMSRSWYSDYYDAPNVDNWLISPQVTLNGQLSYWARGNALYPEHYEVYVSTTTSDTTAFTLLYTPSIVTDNWVEHTVDLSTYAGQQGYIAFRHTDNDKDYLFIDDVLVGSMVTVEAGAWSASIPAIGDSLVIERLSPETAYEWKVQAVCGGEDGSSLWSDSTMFTTPSACDAPVNLAATNETYNSATLSWSNYQETYNLRYRTAADADIYLEDSFEDGELGDWTTILTSSYGGGGVGEGYFYFGYTYNPPQYLISPLLDENGVVEGSTLYFLYQGYSDDLPETFQVGYSSTTNDVSAFTWGTTITIGADVGAYSQTIPAGTKYFAIKHTAYNAWYLYVTNFLVFGPVTPAGEWVDVEGPVENPYTLAGLNPDTPYEFQVQGNNTSCEGDTTAWSQSGWFETLPLPTQTIALVEGANWVSFNVETNLNDLKAALVEAFPNTAISIKSKNQTHSYNPSNNRWSGRFDALNLANMYIIRVVQNGEIVLQGLPVDPSEHPITINAGVSVYLAYPFSENMTLTDAFAGFASNGDKIKSKTKNCNYTRNRWGNQITSLEPGKGYIYVGAADAGDGRVFVYPDNSNRGAQETVQTPKMHIFPDASKATLKAMPIPTIDKKASKSSTKALDKKGMPNEQKD